MLFQIYDEDRWSEIWPALQGKPGTYRVLSKESDTQTPRHISRAIAEDPTGTLYIGMSKDLSKRLAEVRKSLFGAYGHGDGRYSSVSAHQTGKKASETFQKAYPLASIWIEVQPGPVPCAEAPAFNAREEENQQLRRYVAIHGETPPLNG